MVFITTAENKPEHKANIKHKFVSRTHRHREKATVKSIRKEGKTEQASL